MALLTKLTFFCILNPNPDAFLYIIYNLNMSEASETKPPVSTYLVTPVAHPLSDLEHEETCGRLPWRVPYSMPDSSGGSLVRVD